MQGRRERNERGEARVVVGVVAVVALLVALLIAVVVLTFSVQVSGQSMQPTLRSGDRLEVDLLHRHDVRRFDLVEASEPGDAAGGGGTRIVKRVIGLPGDQVAIVGGVQPIVLLRPAGSPTMFRVDNPSWPTQIGSATAACCAATGRSLPSTAGEVWITVPAGSFWVLGDNWGGSTDSRMFGFVTLSDINARLTWRILPWGRMGSIPSQARLIPQPAARG